MGEYGCQWNKPLLSKKLHKADFVKSKKGKRPEI